MNNYKSVMKVAALSESEIDSINSLQSKIKTLDNKGVVLVAYEK